MFTSSDGDNRIVRRAIYATCIASSDQHVTRNEISKFLWIQTIVQFPNALTFTTLAQLCFFAAQWFNNWSSKTSWRLERYLLLEWVAASSRFSALKPCSTLILYSSVTSKGRTHLMVIFLVRFLTWHGSWLMHPFKGLHHFHQQTSIFLLQGVNTRDVITNSD